VGHVVRVGSWKFIQHFVGKREGKRQVEDRIKVGVKVVGCDSSI
jgi:hypothetical protein